MESRRKSKWDYVLEEMQWLANDFAQVRLTIVFVEGDFYFLGFLGILFEDYIFLWKYGTTFLL